MFPEMLPNPSKATLREPGRIATVLIDTEEDFDWSDPTEGTDHTTAYLTRVTDLQPIFISHGVVPTYLLTYPVLENPDIMRVLARARDRGEADVGIHLHPWVTPPFDQIKNAAQSFGGNLTADSETRKFDRLSARFTTCFGTNPLIFRAGRYGLGARSAALIEQSGIMVDTSVAPRTSMTRESGPDYSAIDFGPFWFGAHRPILELPLGRAIVGWGSTTGSDLYRTLMTRPKTILPLTGILARSRCAERITLSPEGNDPRAITRLVRGLISRGQTILPLSFHSSSLAPGRNPYVRSTADLHRFYDDLSTTLCTLTDQFACRFTAAAMIPALLNQPAPAAAPT